MPVCSDCGGTAIEYDNAAGNAFCIKCGTVVEENTIVNEVTFGETNSGAAMVQGSFVAIGATHAKMNGPFGNRSGGESREQTLANASKKIQQIANVLRLSEVVCFAATRLYTLAVENKFTKGRKSLNVVAVCLYVACRQKETRNYMLIDFSDLLQVNVFELGHSYLQMVQALNLRLPLVDPAHYISRFASLLEFGDETHKVATDAVRLVQRFDRDWMTRGRRPAGICGAALLLAARMNNFRRSVEEIVQVVKIADTTLKKRLEEFRNTPSGNLTLADFRTVWLEEEVDPPAFTKGREKEEKDKLDEEEDKFEAEIWDDQKETLFRAQQKGKGKNRKDRKGGKRKREDTDDEADATGHVQDKQDDSNVAGPSSGYPFAIDPVLLDDGVIRDAMDQILDATGGPAPNMLDSEGGLDPHSTLTALSTFDETVSSALAEEVSAFLTNTQGSTLSTVLDEADQRRKEAMLANVVDDLTGLDEEELDGFLLNDEEVKLKERVWVELNRDYLEALAAKGDPNGNPPKTRKRKKPNKPRDATTAQGETAAESVKNLLKKNPKYSKRINYDVLKDLFVDNDDDTFRFPGQSGSRLDLDHKDDLYSMDDKIDDSQIIQEEAGRVDAIPQQPSQKGGPLRFDDGGKDAEDDGDDEEDTMVDGGWEDAYEQEI